MKRWTKTRTPGGAGIKECILTVWWQCAKQLSQQICADKSQFPEHLHFLSVCNGILNVSSRIVTSLHSLPALPERQTLFGRSLAILLEGLQFSSSRQGRGRWMASMASRYIEGRAIETNEPCYITVAQRSTIRLGWNQRCQLLHRSPESQGPWKSAFLQAEASLISDQKPLFCFLPAWALFNWKQTADYLAFKDFPGFAFRCRKQIMGSIQPRGVLLRM